MSKVGFCVLFKVFEFFVGICIVVVDGVDCWVRSCFMTELFVDWKDSVVWDVVDIFFEEDIGIESNCFKNCVFDKDDKLLLVLYNCVFVVLVKVVVWDGMIVIVVLIRCCGLDIFRLRWVVSVLVIVGGEVICCRCCFILIRDVFDMIRGNFFGFRFLGCWDEFKVGWLLIFIDWIVGKDGGDVGFFDMLVKLFSLELDMFLGSRVRFVWEAVDGVDGVDVILVRGCMDCKCVIRFGVFSWGGRLFFIEGKRFVWNDVLSCDKFIVYNIEFDIFFGSFFFLGWFEVSICFDELNGLILFINWLEGFIILILLILDDVSCWVWIFLSGFCKYCCCGGEYGGSCGCLIGDDRIVFCIGDVVWCCLFVGFKFGDCVGIVCFSCVVKFFFCKILL